MTDGYLRTKPRCQLLDDGGEAQSTGPGTDVLSEAKAKIDKRGKTDAIAVGNRAVRRWTAFV